MKNRELVIKMGDCELLRQTLNPNGLDPMQIEMSMNLIQMGVVVQASRIVHMFELSELETMSFMVRETLTPDEPKEDTMEDLVERMQALMESDTTNPIEVRDKGLEDD